MKFFSGTRPLQSLWRATNPAPRPGYHAETAVQECIPIRRELQQRSSRSTDSDVVFGGGGERPLRRRVLEGLGER